MLWHAIAPVRRYTKASHDVVRHPRLCSDAKILLLYVQGLPDEQTHLALSEHARKLGIKGRAFQRAKEQLIVNGFVHERRVSGERGLWVTQQLFSNVPLSDADALGVWREAGVGGDPSPGAHFPAVGRPGPRTVGRQLPVGEEREKNSSHPPTEPPHVSEALVELSPEEAEAERVLLSLRHVDRQLRLGVLKRVSL
ncbi:Helix-turn-helix domain-containing protein OS=Streptomyces microflavus OX=1919 GN=Smic_37820 PE=4 SV=1 [Streptomyces microflavus]